MGMRVWRSRGRSWVGVCHARNRPRDMWASLKRRLSKYLFNILVGPGETGFLVIKVLFLYAKNKGFICLLNIS